MDAQAFWNVIGNYNEQTWIIQIILFIFVLSAIALSYMQKVKWTAKFSLGNTNIFKGKLTNKYEIVMISLMKSKGA